MNHLEFDMPKDKSSIIKGIGVGGAGSNAINHMYRKGIKGVNFIVANTDEQHLNMSPIGTKILLGPELTKGLGTGADPEIGRKATEESILQVKEELSHGTRMLFIAAGMGKGTGTGGSPVIAKLAKEMGILTVAIVTTPFSMLGKSAVKKAEDGIEKLKENVDALIVVGNDKIIEIYGKLKGSEAFSMADDILANAAKGIAEIITGAGIHNTDFNDVRNVLTDGGMTIMGIGYAKGDNRAKEAVQNALKSPLLSDYNIEGAHKALVNISYSIEHECTMDEIGDIIEAVNEAANTDIEIMYGTSEDNTLEEELAVTIVVTGFEDIKKVDKTYSDNNKSVTTNSDLFQSEPIKNDNIIEIDHTEKEIIINFNTSYENSEELTSAQYDNDLESKDEIEIEISDADTSFFDEMGRVLEESDEDKRRRMLSNISYDVHSPLNSSDQLDLGLPAFNHKSNNMISEKDNLFAKDNRLDPFLD